MSQHAWKLLRMALLGLLLGLFLPVPALAQDPPPPEEAEVAPFDPRFGVVDSFVNTAEANAAGAGWTRVFFRWDVVQPAGPSDWKPTNVPDTFLDAEVAAGREVAAVLIGTPTWATDSGISTAVPPPEFWGDFVFKIATQYQGRVKHWIIWNQPDIADPTSPNYTWEGNEEDYYRLLKEAYLKIKAVDPTMQVHLAGLTYTWDQERGQRQYLERLLDVILADPDAATNNYYFDAVSYHLYYNPAQIHTALTEVRQILDSRGLGDKAIWLNETNAPPSEDFIEPPAIPPPLSITLDEQSAFIIQATALALAAGAERVAINKMRNDPGALVLNGLLRSDNSRRPAFAAFQTVTTHFAGVRSATRQTVGNVTLVTLDRAGQTTTVLWNNAPTPTAISLPAIAGEGILVDEQGNEQPLTAANGFYNIELPGALCSNGNNCFIGGPPRLVIETGSPEQRAALPAPAAQSVATPTLTATATITSPSAVTTTPAPPPTLTPAVQASAVTPTAETETSQSAEPAPAADIPPTPTGDEAAAPAALPDPDPGQTEAVTPPATASTDTAIPPVTFSSVMSPRRLLILFLVGLLVFTVTYGVQVIIWYKLKR